MTRKRNLDEEKITVEDIFKRLSHNFDDTYAELHACLCGKSTYKRLRRIGEQQFFNATESNAPIEEESQRIKMRFAEINLFAVSVDNLIDAIISEKFQSDFRSTLKEEVLKTVLKLYSEQNDSSQEKDKNGEPLQPTENPDKVKQIKDDEVVVLEKIKDLSKYFAQNLNDISKQVIEMPLEEIVTDAAENTKITHPRVKEEKDDLSNLELGNISFDSLSSVHTSDLSSFDGEISISSDEETGRKGKKLSWKMAEEEIVHLRAKKKEARSGSKNQVKRIKSKDLQSEISPDDSSSVRQKSLSQRARKPNAKYDSHDIISPLRKKSTGKNSLNKSSTSGQVSETVLPRKRGRPKKNL